MVSRLALWLFCFSTGSAAPEGILMSGGYDNAGRTSVEVFVPSTGQSCSLPSLPDRGRYGHTMDSLLICGSGHEATAARNCLSFSSGQWVTSHTLVEERSFQTSWKTDQGLVLMGSLVGETGYTSEIVPMAGEQGELSFAMQYESSNACAISDLTSDSVIITGGYSIKQLVVRYDWQGYVEDMPSLLVGRVNHGCGSYLREDGTQVLLVAGGMDSPYDDPISSTEVLTSDSPAWTMATPLPRALWGVRGVTVSNILYLTGGSDGSDARDEIIAWLDEEQEWEENSKMKKVRNFHAVTTIQLDDVAMEYCG